MDRDRQFLEHLRRVHFSLVLVSVALIIAASLTPSGLLPRAYEQAKEVRVIDEFIKKFVNDDWLDKQSVEAQASANPKSWPEVTITVQSGGDDHRFTVQDPGLMVAPFLVLESELYEPTGPTWRWASEAHSLPRLLRTWMQKFRGWDFSDISSKSLRSFASRWDSLLEGNNSVFRVYEWEEHFSAMHYNYRTYGETRVEPVAETLTLQIGDARPPRGDERGGDSEASEPTVRGQLSAHFERLFDPNLLVDGSGGDPRSPGSELWENFAGQYGDIDERLLGAVEIEIDVDWQMFHNLGIEWPLARGGSTLQKPRIQAIVRGVIWPLHLQQRIVEDAGIVGFKRGEGTFSEVFPELEELSRGLDALSPIELENYLRRRLDEEGGSVSLIGVSVPRAALSAWGAPVLLGIQFYFLLYLRRYRRGSSGLADYPWIGIDPAIGARAGFLLSITCLPVAASVMLLRSTGLFRATATSASADAILSSGILILLCLGTVIAGGLTAREAAKLPDDADVQKHEETDAPAE